MEEIHKDQQRVANVQKEGQTQDTAIGIDKRQDHSL